MAPRPPCITHLGWPCSLDQVFPIHAALASMHVVRVRRRLVAVMALAGLVDLVAPASALLVRSRLGAPIGDRLRLSVCHANYPPLLRVPAPCRRSQGVITLRDTGARERGDQTGTILIEEVRAEVWDLPRPDFLGPAVQLANIHLPKPPAQLEILQHDVALSLLE